MFSILSELLPRKARLVLYVLFALTGVVIAAWQAAEGDWLTFAASLSVTLVGWLAASNVTPPVEEIVSKAPQPVLEREVAERGDVIVNRQHFADLTVGPPNPPQRSPFDAPYDR